MAVTFDEILLNQNYSAIAQGGPEGATLVITSPQSGYTQRNVGRFDQQHKYSIDYSLLNPADRRDLKLFHLTRDARARGFRFKDWDDFWFAADGSPDDPVGTPNQFGTGDGSTTAFGLYKRYQSAGITRDRRIVKPVAGGLSYDTRTSTIKIYVNDVLKTVTTDYTVSSSTGIVTFVSPPANAATLKVTGEFDVPVFFTSDWFSPEIRDAVTAGAYNGIGLEEIVAVNFELSV